MVDIGAVFCHKCFKDLDNGDEDIYIYNKMWFICSKCKGELGEVLKEIKYNKYRDLLKEFKAQYHEFMILNWFSQYKWFRGIE